MNRSDYPYRIIWKNPEFASVTGKVCRIISMNGGIKDIMGNILVELPDGTRVKLPRPALKRRTPTGSSPISFS